MAWFEGLSSSLKGQITNLAKGVLNDDTDSGQNDGEAESNSSFLNISRASNDPRPGTSGGWDDDIVTDSFVNQSSPEPRHNETSQNISEPQEEEETSLIPKKLASFLSLGKGSDAEEQIAALQEENRTLRLENEAKNNEIRNFTRIIRELESTVAVGQDENSNLSTGMEELDIQHQQAIEQVLSVKEETHKQLEALQKAYADLEESHKTLTEEKADGGRRESSQSEELIKVREENDKLIKEMEELRKKANRNDVLIQELEEKDKELDELENANSALRSDIELLKNEAENNRSSLPPILENDEEIESLNNKISSLTIENASLKEEILNLKDSKPEENLPAPENDERVEALEHRISNLESEITILREVRQNLETENNNSYRKIERLTLRLHTAEGSIRNYDNLQIEAERLRDIKDQDDREIREKKRYIKDLEQQLEQSRQENEELKKELSEKDQNNEVTWYENRGKEELMTQENTALKKKLSQMEDQAKKVDQELETLQKEIEVKQNKLCELTFEINSVSDELKNSNRKEAELKLQIKEMELKLDSSKDELEDTQEVGKLSQFKEELVKLSEENSKIQKELFEKINEISSLKESMIAERENFAVEKSNYEKVIENLNSVSNEFHIYKDIQKQKDSEFKRQLETKEDELNKMKALMEEKEFAWNEQSTKAMADFEEKFKEQEDLLQKIELDRTEAENSQVDELKKKLEQAKKDLDAIKAEYDNREKTILEDAKLSYERNEKLISKMMSEKDEQLISAVTDYNNLRSQYETIAQRCSTLDSKLKDVTNENKNLLKNIQTTEVITAGLVSEVEQTKSALKQEKEKCDKLEATIEEFKAERSKVENELKEKESYLEQIDGAKSKEINVLKQEVESLKNQLEYATQLMHVAERQEAEGRGVTPPPQNQNDKETQEELNRITTALLKEQTENKLLANEVTELKDTNTKLNTQLSRLKSHLLELENYYTSMEVSSQEKIAELEAKQAKVDDWFKSSSTAYTSANIRANQQVESLTQQVRLLTEHKEKMGAELSRAEDEAQKQLAAVTNLQAVLHQFQRDKQRDIEFETDRIKQKLNQSYKANDELAKQIDDLREQLNETKKGLVAATRLTEQLDQKEELIKSLKNEVADLQKKLISTEEKLSNINSTFEAKIDRNLIKNLLVGYVSSGPKYKEQALRVISQVLELSKEERQRVGLDTDGNSHSEQGSLSEAFIRFLETESQPKQQVFVPLSQPSSTNPSRKNSQSSSGSILLDEAQMNLPNFTGRNAGSILKDVLKDRNS